MKRLMLVLAALAALGFVFSGCKKDQPPAEPEPPGDEVRKDEPPPPEPPPPDEKGEPKGDEPKGEEPKAEGPGGPGDAIGIPECDEYIGKYMACIGSKVPEAAREAMEKGLNMARDGWKKMAGDEAQRAALGAACKTAMEAAKQATTAYNCEW